MLKDRTVNKVNQDTYAKLFHHLMHIGERTGCGARELAEVCGLHLVTVYDLMRTLKRHEVVHISGWDQDRRGRDSIALFAFGQGKDAPRKRKTRAKIAQDYRTRRKQLKLNATPAPTQAPVDTPEPTDAVAEPALA